MTLMKRFIAKGATLYLNGAARVVAGGCFAALVRALRAPVLKKKRTDRGRARILRLRMDRLVGSVSL